MADKWAQYIEPAPPTTDRWAKYAEPPSSEANAALSGTGLSVSPPKGPPVPPGLAPEQDISPWRDPTQGLIGQGVRQMGRGIAGLTREGLDPKLEAASDIMRGAGKVAAPAAIGATFPMVAANPLGAAIGLGAGAAGAAALGRGGSAATKALGGGPGLQALTGDTGELVGGLLGFKVGSKVSPNILDADPRVAINRSLRPIPSDPGFSKRIPQTLARVKQANPGFKPDVENGELNLTPAANRAITATQDALKPWMIRAEGTTVSGDPIVQATREATRGMLPSESASADALIERAQQDYGHDFTPQQLRDRLILLNKRYNSFASQAPGKQTAALADIPEAVLKAQRDSAADTLYRHLDPEGEGAGPRLIQSKTGDLIDLKNASLRRQNAVLAEQPLTPFGKFADPLKAHIRAMLPGKATGAGIAFAEGSEGRSLPMMQRAFKSVNQPPNVLPKPGTELYPRDQNVQRQLGPGPPRMPESSEANYVHGMPAEPVETEWQRLPAGRDVREMPAIPDTSGDRSWTGPPSAPNPLRQLPSGPTPPPQRLPPSGGTVVTKTGDQSRVQSLPARKVVDPKTGRVYYVAEPQPKFAKGGVVLPKRKSRPHTSRRGIYYGPKGSMPPQPFVKAKPMPMEPL